MSSDLLTAAAPLAPSVDAPAPRDDTHRAQADAVQQAAPAEAAAPQPPKLTETARRDAAEAAAKAVPDMRLEVQVENDGLVMVKVRDAKTDKVVREIPPEELVEFGRKMRQMTGLLVDRTA